MYVCMYVTTAHSYVTLYTYAACICDPIWENMHGSYSTSDSDHLEVQKHREWCIDLTLSRILKEY